MIKASELLVLIDAAGTKGISKIEIVKALNITSIEAAALARQAVAANQAWMANRRLYSTAPF